MCCFRTSWTDTPQDKLKKARGDTEANIDLKREAENLAVQKYDREQEEKAKKHKKKRDKSLLEQHQDKLKQKKKVRNLFFFIYINRGCKWLQ